ncbi:hypothetical protein AMK28_34680 [Streptomyces sp. CB02115]|nr:hypothetical protein AMK28_34680 [Streptomyces sp. CB02115]
MIGLTEPGGSVYRCGSAPDFDRTSPVAERSLARAFALPRRRVNGSRMRSVRLPGPMRSGRAPDGSEPSAVFTS